MKLTIDKNYQITSDNLQYILQEVKIVQQEGDNKGNEYVENVGYHGKLTSCLKHYKELQIRKSDVNGVNELMALIDNIDKKIDAFLKDN